MAKYILDNLTEPISTVDLVQCLKDCAQAFQNMSQGEDNSAYLPLALHLASETFLKHPSKEVRILVAICIADVFRVYPVHPYKDLSQLKVIFEFFVDQLRGLEGPSEEPLFPLYCYLLENFSRVQTWKICAKLEDNQEIMCRLFKLMFKIINENEFLESLILDMLSPLIGEADYALQSLLLSLILIQNEPLKSENKKGYALARHILHRNDLSLRTYIHQSDDFPLSEFKALSITDSNVMNRKRPHLPQGHHQGPSQLRMDADGIESNGKDLPDQPAQEVQGAILEAQGEYGTPCPICLKRKDTSKGEFVAVVCGHVFCYKCVRDIMSKSGRRQCPTCRKQLRRRKNRRLYY